MMNRCGFYHLIGTCRMESVVGAVVDKRFRVPGADGLRVVDASIMSTIVSSNSSAPPIMVGERATRFIAETVDRQRRTEINATGD